MRTSMPRSRLAGWSRTAVIVMVATGLATASVQVAERWLGVTNASALYLLAVIAVAGLCGTWASIATAAAAFLAYDFLFVSPTLTLTVSDPGEWLELVLLLVVGIVVGQLAGGLRARADVAEAREREARGLFGISRALATGASTAAALPLVMDAVAREAHMDHVWLGLEAADGRPIGDPRPADVELPASHAVLHVPGAGAPPAWTRVHAPTDGRPRRKVPAEVSAYRVPVLAGGTALGSLWATRPRGRGEPGPSETRLLAAAADQVGARVANDRLAALATDAEIARRSDAAKSALLDSVSHAFRTPLATIRAAAGTLLDPGVELDEAARTHGAATIDREAEHLDRLVTNLLDLSRIEAGSLQPRLAVHVLEDLVLAVLARSRGLLGPRVVVLDLPADLPPVLVDDVLLDQVLTNLVENIARHTPPSTSAAIRATAGVAVVRLRIEDDGPGVPDEELPRLFTTFHRVRGRRSSRGSGIGLAVARGLLAAMDGTIEASGRAGGGLAFDLTLVRAPLATSAS